MEGPFLPIVNKWRKTPLKRIENDIEEIEKELRILTQNFGYLTEEIEKNKINSKINDLKETIKLLKKEYENRKEKVKNLNKKRNELLEEVSKLKYKQYNTKSENQRIKEIHKKINKYDIELGPLKYSNEEFYLE